MWYLRCPGCGGELRFLYCDDVMLCCAHEMLEFLHGAPYAVCVVLKNFYLFVFCFGGLFFVSCVGVWECEELGWVGCDGNMWGESGRVGCIRSRV